jgi:tripartite-type tricarboxylate transporter receptor subunit TctC
VPFEGSNGNLAALAGKHIDFSMVTASSAMPLIGAGKLRPLVMFSNARDPFFPEVPTAKELGFDLPVVSTVRGLLAPPKTPDAIVRVLEDACAMAIKEPAYLDWAKKRQITLRPFGSREFMEWIVKEAYPTVEQYEGIMKAAQPSQ